MDFILKKDFLTLNQSTPRIFKEEYVINVLGINSKSLNESSSVEYRKLVVSENLILESFWGDLKSIPGKLGELLNVFKKIITDERYIDKWVKALEDGVLKESIHYIYDVLEKLKLTNLRETIDNNLKSINNLSGWKKAFGLTAFSVLISYITEKVKKIIPDVTNISRKNISKLIEGFKSYLGDKGLGKLATLSGIGTFVIWGKRLFNGIKHIVDSLSGSINRFTQDETSFALWKEEKGVTLKENLLLEGGIRNINNLAKRYKKAKIYFHQDLDGVTTAIGMKNYLERNGIKVVDAEIIQYGDKEFSIKKPDASGEIMPVLVDFAHGKPMFVIHTDHHDSQAGVEKGTSTSFRHSRSNVETISNIISVSDIFPSNDIMMISTIDSADYARLDITPDEVMNYVFNLDKGKNLERNKIIMALVTNKLLLAYKNKPKFLETLVMVCTPSLLNIYQNIVKLAKESGYATAQEMKANLDDYIEAQSKNTNVDYDSEYGIIKQYGGGSMFKPGSYDRYVPFKLNPEANFLVISWPLGLLQASCNPFKKERALKGVDLGKIKDSVLKKFESELESKIISVDTIKYFAEKNKEFTEDSVGFTYNDLIAIYGSDGDFFFKEMVDYENEGNFKNASTYLNKQIEFVTSILSSFFSNTTQKIIDSIEIIKVSLPQRNFNIKLIKKYKNVLVNYNKRKITDCFNELKFIRQDLGHKNPDINLLFKTLIYVNKFRKLMVRDQDKENQEIYINRRNEFFKLKNEFLKDISSVDEKYKNFFGGVGSLSNLPSTNKEDYTVTKWGTALKRILEKPYSKLTEKETKVLKMLKLTGWDIIQSNSGGHKCITNISGLMYFGKDGVPFLKKFSEEFVNQLKAKIDNPEP